MYTFKNIYNIASLFCGHPVMLWLIKTLLSSKDDSICGHGVTPALISLMAILTNPAGKSLLCSLFPAMMVGLPIGVLLSSSKCTLSPSFTVVVLSSTVLSTEASVVNPEVCGYNALPSIKFIGKHWIKNSCMFVCIIIFYNI